MEKEAVDKKFVPSKWLSAFLYAYFALTLLYALSLVDLVRLSHAPIFQADHYVLFVPGCACCLFYSLAAIFSLLSGKTNSILAMRLSIVLFLLMHDAVGRELMAYRHFQIIVLYVLQAFVSLFLIFLFFYIRHVKCVVDGIPKTTRNVGALGWIGIVYSVLFVAICYGPSFEKVFYRVRSQPVEILYDSEMTDGLIVFSPLDSWTDISGSCGGRKFIFDTGNGGVATVHSSIEKHFSRLSFSEELSKDFPDSCYSESDAIEVSFLNSSINGNPMCVSTYKLWGDTAMDSVGIWYWSFAILKSQNGDEECVLSVLEPDKYGGNEVVVHFMNKVRFP